jgi:hypothetical protein
MLNWTRTSDNLYTAEFTIVDFDKTDESGLCEAFESCAEHAIGLLTENIQDDSLYLLFEWDRSTSILNIVVTDASKKNDSSIKVTCVFSGIEVSLNKLDKASREEREKEYVDSIKFWLHDYLPINTTFLNYSLVAIFHSSSRAETELL